MPVKIFLALHCPLLVYSYQLIQILGVHRILSQAMRSQPPLPPPHPPPRAACFPDLVIWGMKEKQASVVYKE